MTQTEYDETRATTQLPNLDIEVVHRRAWGGEAEQVSITLRGTPSLEAFGAFIEAANPFATWMRLMQMAWTPWLGGFGETAATRLAPPSAATRKLPAPGSR